MISITNVSDLNRAVALALCDEPPLSERRAIHESGVWRWVMSDPTGVPCKACSGSGNFYGPNDEDRDWLDCDDCRGKGGTMLPAHWEPADFCGDPAASKLLEDRMISDGWRWEMCHRWIHDERAWVGWFVALDGSKRNYYEARHPERLIAMCVAALRALGVEFELVTGWEER